MDNTSKDAINSFLEEIESSIAQTKKMLTDNTWENLNALNTLNAQISGDYLVKALTLEMQLFGKLRKGE